ALVATVLAEAALLGERRLDGAASDLWHSPGQGPVDLLRGALCQGSREFGRGRRRARDDEDAGGIAVETVHELGPRVLFEGEAVEHAVDMLCQSAAALRRQARRLVEHDD